MYMFMNDVNKLTKHSRGSRCKLNMQKSLVQKLLTLKI